MSGTIIGVSFLLPRDRPKCYPYFGLHSQPLERSWVDTYPFAGDPVQVDEIHWEPPWLNVSSIERSRSNCFQHLTVLCFTDSSLVVLANFSSPSPYWDKFTHPLRRERWTDLCFCWKVSTSWQLLQPDCIHRINFSHMLKYEYALLPISKPTRLEGS